MTRKNENKYRSAVYIFMLLRDVEDNFEIYKDIGDLICYLGYIYLSYLQIKNFNKSELEQFLLIVALIQVIIFNEHSN